MCVRLSCPRRRNNKKQKQMEVTGIFVSYFWRRKRNPFLKNEPGNWRRICRPLIVIEDKTTRAVNHPSRLIATPPNGGAANSNFFARSIKRICNRRETFLTHSPIRAQQHLVNVTNHLWLISNRPTRWWRRKQGNMRASCLFLHLGAGRHDIV